jgi:hypothetical protein
MHTFIQSKPDRDRPAIYSVGAWSPPAYQDKNWKWNALCNCASQAEAAAWVSYLNGGERPSGTFA